MRRLTRIVVVALLVAYALASVYVAGAAFWEPRGTLGLLPGYGSAIRGVTPGGPADLAGVVAGDRIHLSATPFEDRRYLAGVGAAAPIGTIVNFALTRDNVTRNVVLTAVPSTLTGADRSSLLFQCVASLVFVVVGATLILLRPSDATWGFGLYCLIVLPTANYPFQILSAKAAFAVISFYDVLQTIGVVGLLVFALEFPRRFETAWRTRIRRALPALFIVLAAMMAYPDVANLQLGVGAQTENRLLQVVLGAIDALAFGLLVDTYRRIAVDERERLRWVLAGFGIGLLGNDLGSTIIFSTLLAFDAPAWILNLLVSSNVLLPITVAHAVVRHRVLDIDFVVSRALVYGALTAALAALFAVLDWSFGHLLEDFRLSYVIEAGISISIAFAFDTLHKRAERLVEVVFFKKRRAAELQLDRLTDVLPQARSVAVVQEALIDEAVGALELTSGALFVSTGAGGFTRTAARGWRESDCMALDDTDMLVLALRGTDRSIDLAALPWRRTNIPTGAQAPVVAMRMHARADIAGIVLYGGHWGGSTIDPAELAQLERLTQAAGVALDELEAERLRAETAVQAASIDELTARLDELRRVTSQPANIQAPRASGTTVRVS